MAIQGNIEVEAFGTKVVLMNKYMRLSNCRTVNEFRLTEVHQPNGTDGNPNAPQQKLIKHVEATGTLEIYNTALDAAEGKPVIMSKQYTIPYDNTVNAPIAETQLYAHIMKQPEISGAIQA
jgi:hypothetical protein